MVGGLWFEHADAYQPPLVIDALDRVSVQLKLAHDGGREVNPARAQLGKSDRLVAGSAQSLKHSLLLAISERHRPDCRPRARVACAGRRSWAWPQTVWSSPGDAKSADNLLAQGVDDLIVCNHRDALYAGAEHLERDRAALALRTNTHRLKYGREVLQGADVLVGISDPARVSAVALGRMDLDAIVFAMADPVPKVRPEEVHDDVTITATRRSDYPNQINTMLAFPGHLYGHARGARTHNQRADEARRRALHRTASSPREPEVALHTDYITPAYSTASSPNQ